MTSNAEPIVLIGPGSEWFWAAVGSVVTIVTLLAIYRQLRLARSQNAVAQVATYNRDWDSERMLRHRLATLTALRDGANVSDVVFGSARAIGGFWEDIGALTRGGHLNARLLWDGSGGDCADYWLVMKPFARQLRTELRMPTLFENFEWLAGVMRDFSRRAGGPEPDDEYLATMFKRRIAAYQDSIKVEEDLRRTPS